MNSKINNYYPPSPGLKREMYPYDSVEKFKEDVDRLYSAACRLKIIPDFVAGEIDQEIYDHFRTNQVVKKIKVINPYYENEVPDPLEHLYPALPEEKKEEFLYLLRGLIHEKLTPNSAD